MVPTLNSFLLEQEMMSSTVLAPTQITVQIQCLFRMTRTGREVTDRRGNAFNGRIVINIGGEVYETNSKTLARYPQTLLGNFRKRSPYFRAQTGLHYFDRSRLFFDAILFFYQSKGILQCPPELPLSLFEEECRFFSVLQSCL